MKEDLGYHCGKSTQLRLLSLSQAWPGRLKEAPFTHRWARKARESSLTTLTRQTNNAPLTSQTLGTWGTIRTLGEEERADTGFGLAVPLPTC